MKKMLKRLCTGFLALATVVTALPTTPVHAESKQYWTESAERVGIIEKVMNDGSIGSTFNEGYMKVEGETAYCIDINTDFKNGYKTRADASTRMSADQISDVALSIEYVKQYTDSHSGISNNHAYLLRQLVVWQRLSVHLGWQCDNVRASYDEIPKATQDEVFSGARAFVKENKGRYECGGYIYSGEGQELGQFWAKLNIGNAKLKKATSNTSITDGNGNYSIAGATYGVFADKDCTKQLATLTTDENGNTDVVEVKAGTVYIKELSAPAGYKVDKTVYSLKVEAGKTATLKVSDTPKVTDTLIELFKIDMETQKDNPQGNASLAGAEFTWKYYAGFYNKDNLPAEATRTWVTKTIAETDSDGTTHYITKLADAYKISGDSFYMQDGKAVLPLGTLTVEETKAPNGYLLDGAYMQAGDKSEQIKGLYVTQITEDGDLAVLSGSNQFSVSDKVIRGGVKIQKRDLETGDTKPQGSATLKDTAFDIISLNDNAVLVEGKLYKKNEVVKTIRTDIEGIASTSADLLPYGNFRIVESEAPDGYLTDGAKPIDFTITENGKIVDLTDEAHSIYNQIKRGDIEGVKIGAGTHKRLADVPFRITSKTTGENHIVVTDDNGQFSTSSEWASHKHNTNAGKTSEDGVWFGTSEPDDSKGALPYDTYIIEEMRCDSNKGFELIPPFEIVVSRNNLVIDLGTLTDEYEKEISIHTTATSKDGEKTILAGKEVTIVDTVKLDGLTKGTKYQLKGWQMLKEENAELLIDGKRVENDYTFVADDEEMKVEISYTNAVLYILDPKNADLADLGTVMGNVYHTKEEMIDCVNAFYEGMVQRSEEMKRHPNYKTGENYAYLGLPPCFLIFDEYVAFFEMLGTKESVSLLSQLKKIVMLGRQAGYFLIVACQRPDAKYFSDGIRDNFNFRVGLGRISELGYGMLFGSDVKKQFFQKRIKGRGYCDMGTSVISEFYTPLVPKGHDFLQTIGRLAQERQVMPEQQGKEDVIE